METIMSTLYAASDHSDMGTRTFENETDMLNYAADLLSHGNEVDTYVKVDDEWLQIGHFWPTRGVYGS